jgi:PAS domain S-box-containing protein
MMDTGTAIRHGASMSGTKKMFIGRFFPDPEAYSGNVLQLWRERIVAALLTSGLVISVLALAPSIYMAVTEGLWTLILMDTALLPIAFTLLWLRRVPYCLRAAVILSIAYIVGVVVTTIAGIASGGPIWLFSFAVLNGILMGLRPAVVAVAISAVTLVVIGGLHFGGVVYLPGPFFQSVPRAVAAWANFLLLNAMVAISVAVLLRGLQESTEREQEAIKNVMAEQQQLRATQSELRQEIDQRKAAEEELTQQKGILTALHETTLGLIGQLDLNVLLDAIVTKASSLIDSTNGFIYIYDEDQDALVIRAGTGVYGKELLGTMVKPGEGLSGKAFVERHTLIIDEYRDWPQRVSSPYYDDLRSAMAVPIILGGRVIGVLGLGIFSLERKFGAAEDAIMEGFAELCSLVIHNAELYESVKNELTIRKKTETALRERENQYKDLYEESQRAENLYRSLLHSSADAIIVSDEKERVNFVNPAFTQIFGWELDEVSGTTIPFVPDSEMDKTRSAMSTLLSTGKPLRGFETVRNTKTGEMLDVSISASRFDDHDGKPMGKLCIIRDVSENRKLQAQVQQAQRMEAIGTLAGGVAHDFNNLLMGLQGNVSLLQMVLDPESPHQKHLAKMESLVTRGAELTAQLLGFARAGKYEVKATALNELVEKSAEMFGRAKKELIIEKRLAPEMPAVSVDRRQIEQVLLNIFVNAWQAMPKGGTLTIETKSAELTSLDTSGCNCEPGRYACVSISDTGVGMPESVRQRIFDPFYTTKEMGRGTGLGLASTYGIIQNHGGCIKVASQEGKGSTFSIYLPTLPAPEAPKPAAAPKPKTGNGTILLVDDEPFVLDVARQMLERLGYQVKAASDGNEAVAMFEQYRAEIDAVILDMIMPGMGGGEVFDKLQSISPDVRVLLSSGYSIDGEAEEIMNRGCRGFIQKPFSMDKLSTRIREILKDS